MTARDRWWFAAGFYTALGVVAWRQRAHITAARKTLIRGTPRG